MTRDILASIALIATLVLAQTSFAMTGTPTERADRFFSTLATGAVDAAYDDLFAGSAIASAKPQAVAVLKSQTRSHLPHYGSLGTAEVVKREKFGSRLVRLVYVLNQAIHPTVWEFFFYRTERGWSLSHVTFNDEFNGLR